MSDTTPDITTVENSNIIEYKNDNITVKLEKFSGCYAKIEAFISPLASQAAFAKAIKTISKNVSLPGFRAGKAPQELILKKYKSHVEKEWQTCLMNTAAGEVITLTGLIPVQGGGVKNDIVKTSLEEESIVTFSYEYRPEVPLIHLEDLSLKKVEPKPVADEEVEKEIENLRLHSAKWEALEEHAIQEDDYVDLSIQSLEEPMETICENTRFIVQKSKMAPWMHRLLIGLKKGDAVEGISEEDTTNTTYNVEGNSFTPTRFKLTVQGIFKPILPELNEDFFKQIGTTSLDDLKSKIFNQLADHHSNNAKKSFESQIIEQLLTLYPFEIPMLECQEEKNLQSERLREKLESNEISPTEKFRLIQETERYIASLPNNYRLFYLAKTFAKQAKITISEQELASEISHHLILSRTSFDSLIDEKMNPRQVQSMIYNHLLLHKTIQYIANHARIENESV